MRVRLAILDDDKSYLGRIVSMFTTKYAEDLQVYSYTDYQTAVKSLEQIRAHVFLASTAFEVNTRDLPKNCGVAYFVDNSGLASYKGLRAICKYQRLDLIYKQVLNLYTDTADEVIRGNSGDSGCKITAYMSPAGGVGTTTVAVANAQYYASLGRKTLYLNLNPYDSTDRFFHAVGAFNFRNVITDVKSKRSNLGLRLESYVQQDPGGVYFFAQSSLALEMLELTLEDCGQILEVLKSSGKYDMIIVDLRFDLTKGTLELLKKAASIVIIGDGEEVSNAKILRAYGSVETLDRSGMLAFTGQVYIVYNRFSGTTGKMLEGMDWHCAGTIPRFDHISGHQVVNCISQMPIFDKIH